MSTPPTIQISSPFSTPGQSAPPKPNAHVSDAGFDADSDGKNKSNGSRPLLEHAASLVINIETLIKLWHLERADAVRIRDTLIRQYNDICQELAYRFTARQVSHNLLLSVMERETICDENVVAHYDCFVREMEQAETATSEEHKQAMLTKATKNIRLAQKNSQLARDLRPEIENIKAKLRHDGDEIMTARDDMVHLLYTAVLYCLEGASGTVQAKESEDQ
ncbi:hypothetical protein ACET3X_008408 [Alternaria dauci]|uniref:Uncharacterized protein n=1 Tax=Alternaria dauci TaxID=48095 RepID=A0ABR3UA93_9PLEO